MEMKAFGIRACIVQPGDIRTNINQHRLTSDLAESDVYAESFARTSNLMSAGVNNGMEPEIPAKLVAVIISSARIKRLYRVGTFSEKLSVALKNVMPAQLFEKLIRNHYQV